MNELNLGRVLVPLLLMGVTFGYVETAAVVYLRTVYEPLHGRLYPTRTEGDLLPLVPMERLAAEGFPLVAWPAVEWAREGATLLLLAAGALAVARNLHQWIAAFVFGFGLWDLCYYVFLKILLDWPASLLTWDILFLVPVPWVGPVLAPLLVALAMIICGLTMLWREGSGKPVYLSWYHWLGLTAGGSAVVAAFCWDWADVSAGHMPQPFLWPLFALGVGLGVGSFLHACWRSAPPRVSRPDYLTILAASVLKRPAIEKATTRR